MAYAIIHYFPGGTKDQYEKSIAAVHPSSGGLPTGQIFHTAGPHAGWLDRHRGAPAWLTRLCAAG